MPAAEGQYRLRLDRFRFRYDIAGRVVTLVACSLRREDRITRNIVERIWSKKVKNNRLGLLSRRS
ncbi:MAG: hypothetical protein LAQ69_43140 [Acidobacteriia bacterium]|nr:hypothetical protein [Terriglobia bacterium]